MKAVLPSLYLLAALLVVLPAEGVAAAEDRILVTIDDPAPAQRVRSGAPRPGYSRNRAVYAGSVFARREARRLAGKYALEIVEQWPIRPLGVFCIVYVVPGGTDLEQVLAKLRADDRIDSAQAMRTFELRAAVAGNRADPYVRAQHAVQVLGLEQAHRWSTGEGVRIAIIDTGADLGHADLADQAIAFHDFAGRRDEGSGKDRHGTAVTGIIAARPNNGVGVVGIAPGASTSLLKACWYAPGMAPARCDSVTIAKALTHAIESGADVINLSLTGPEDPLLGRLTDVAVARGTVVVAAAPKMAADTALFPSSLPGVITVEAYEAPAALRATARTAVSAPGVDVLVLAPGDTYELATGSSLAAAHVSGIASLLLARETGLGSADIVSLLSDSRMAAGDSVNACRALAALLEQRGCAPTVSQRGD